MANFTPNFHLKKPTENERYNVEDFNGNADILDEELAARGKTINGEGPDETGNWLVNEVDFARQIVTDDAQQSSAEFLFRTTGGDASLSDGPAKLVAIYGRNKHEGYVAESLNMTVNAATRPSGTDPITATIDRDTFVGQVSESGTITLTYTNSWSANPGTYGVTVEGTPVSGDQIVIVYVKEELGTITTAQPTGFRSTGWNLYDYVSGYARVKKYSSQYGFLIGGTYSTLKYSATLEGEKSTITPVSGYFTIPDDGYLWVTGGNDTDTYILMTWSDWDEGYEGDWEAYDESEVDLSSIMTYFPNGIMSVGNVADEINFSMGRAISRIMRMENTPENMADAKASGRAWDADDDYIYIVRPAEEIYTIAETGDYTACDHGLEMIDGSDVPVFVETLYGRNLVDYLRHDVPEQLAALNSKMKPMLLATITNQSPQTTVSIVDYTFVVVVNGNALQNVGAGTITPVSVFTDDGATQLISTGNIGGGEYALFGNYSNGNIIFNTPASGTYRIYGIR